MINVRSKPCLNWIFGTQHRLAQMKSTAYKVAMAMATVRRKSLRWLGRIALVFVACYVALLLYVQVSERVMRHRAERLLAEMRELEVGKSTWANLQGIKSRWGAWGNYDGTCTVENCNYEVSLADVAGGPRFDMLVAALGRGHLAYVTLRVMVEQGIVKQASFDLWVYVPKGYGARWEREQPQDPGYTPYSSGEYTLIARASSRLELGHLCCYWPDPVPHPNYVLKKPGGCEGCLAIWTEFLPRAASVEKMRLTHFNFNCITRWKPCADEEDIMPGIGTEYEQQSRERMIRYGRQDQCDYPVTELSAAALNAAVVRVESIPTEGSNAQEYPKLRLIKRLGGNAVWDANETVSIDALMEGQQGRLISDAFKQGKPLVVLYPQSPKAKMLMPYTCGLLPYSEQVEKDVTAGVSLGKGIPEEE
jgi:hypothetical protein